MGFHGYPSLMDFLRVVILIEPTISSDGCGQLEEDVGALRNRYLIVDFQGAFGNIRSRVYLIPSEASFSERLKFGV